MRGDYYAMKFVNPIVSGSDAKRTTKAQSVLHQRAKRTAGRMRLKGWAEERRTGDRKRLSREGGNERVRMRMKTFTHTHTHTRDSAKHLNPYEKQLVCKLDAGRCTSSRSHLFHAHRHTPPQTMRFRISLEFTNRLPHSDLIAIRCRAIPVRCRAVLLVDLGLQKGINTGKRAASNRRSQVQAHLLQ
jgi:hypothetical protein